MLGAFMAQAVNSISLSVIDEDVFERLSMGRLIRVPLKCFFPHLIRNRPMALRFNWKKLSLFFSEVGAHGWKWLCRRKDPPTSGCAEQKVTELD